MQRFRKILAGSLIVAIVVLVTFILRHGSSKHGSSKDEKWIALNGWLVDAVTNGSTSLPLPYTFVGINEPGLKSIKSKLYGNTITLQNYAVSSLKSINGSTTLDTYNIFFFYYR